MSCQSCVSKVSDALKGLAEKVEVTLKPPRAILTGSEIPSFDVLNDAVKKAGNYVIKPVEVSANPTDEEKREKLVQNLLSAFFNYRINFLSFCKVRSQSK